MAGKGSHDQEGNQGLIISGFFHGVHIPLYRKAGNASTISTLMFSGPGTLKALHLRSTGK